jgi:hypothetical protein
LVFVKFEEEGRKPVSLREPRPSLPAAAPEPAQPTESAPPKQEVKAKEQEHPQIAFQDLEEEKKVEKEGQKPEGMRTGEKKLEFSGAPPELAQSTEPALSTQG